MSLLIESVDSLLGVLTILAQIASLGLIIALISKGKILGAYKTTIERNVLSVGFVVSLIATGILPCSAVGYAASCSTQFTLQWGYITIPLMAFSAFLLIALATLASRGKKDYSSPKS